MMYSVFSCLAVNTPHNPPLRSLNVRPTQQFTGIGKRESLRVVMMAARGPECIRDPSWKFPFSSFSN